MNQAIYLTEYLHKVIHLQCSEKNTSESQILQYIAIYNNIQQYIDPNLNIQQLRDLTNQYTTI
jgi:hypothetical protein